MQQIKVKFVAKNPKFIRDQPTPPFIFFANTLLRTRKDYKSGRKYEYSMGVPRYPPFLTYSKLPTPLFVTNSIWN